MKCSPSFRPAVWATPRLPKQTDQHEAGHFLEQVRPPKRDRHTVVTAPPTGSRKREGTTSLARRPTCLPVAAQTVSPPQLTTAGVVEWGVSPYDRRPAPGNC